jgi:hypothetical protein
MVLPRQRQSARCRLIRVVTGLSGGNPRSHASARALGADAFHHQPEHGGCARKPLAGWANICPGKTPESSLYHFVTDETEAAHGPPANSNPRYDQRRAPAPVLGQADAVLRGAPIAIVCNGPQLVIFQAMVVGQSPLEGECYLFNGFDTYVGYFPALWSLLSPEGVAENRAQRDLALYRNPRIPSRAATAIPEPTKPRYRNDFLRKTCVLSRNYC